MRFFIFLFLVFSFQSFAQEKPVPDTEAGFTFECEDCKKNADLKEDMERQECLALINSKECEGIPDHEKRNCTEPWDGLRVADSVLILLNCVKDFFVDAYDFIKFILNFTWFAIQFVGSTLFGPEYDPSRSSSQSLALAEFYKVYSSAEGTKAERWIKAVMAVAGDALSKLGSSIMAGLGKWGKCSNAKTKLENACTFTALAFIPLGILVKSAKGVAIATGAVAASGTVAGGPVLGLGVAVGAGGGIAIGAGVKAAKIGKLAKEFKGKMKRAAAARPDPRSIKWAIRGGISAIDDATFGFGIKRITRQNRQARYLRHDIESVLPAVRGQVSKSKLSTAQKTEIRTLLKDRFFLGSVTDEMMNVGKLTEKGLERFLTKKLTNGDFVLLQKLSPESARFLSKSIVESIKKKNGGWVDSWKPYGRILDPPSKPASKASNSASKSNTSKSPTPAEKRAQFHQSIQEGYWYPTGAVPVQQRIFYQSLALGRGIESVLPAVRQSVRRANLTPRQRAEVQKLLGNEEKFFTAIGKDLDLVKKKLDPVDLEVLLSSHFTKSTKMSNKTADERL